MLATRRIHCIFCAQLCLDFYADEEGLGSMGTLYRKLLLRRKHVFCSPEPKKQIAIARESRNTKKL